MSKLLSIIIPIYNEEQIIPELYKRLSESAQKITSDYELIFINDGSKDLSLLELIKISDQDKKVFFINFSKIFIKIQRKLIIVSTNVITKNCIFYNICTY